MEGRITNFKNEGKIKKIGGRVEQDYYTLKSEIEYINDNYFELFSMLGFSDDIDTMIKALTSNPSRLKYIYKEKVMRDIKEGKIPRHKFLSSKYDDLENLPPDERKKKETAIKRIIGLKTTYLFGEICEKYKRTYKIFEYEPKRFRVPFEICRKAIYVTPTQIAIDVDKFIEIYSDFVESDESITRRHHQEAADAMNRFFNGAVVITEKEIFKYFKIEGGILKVRTDSVNRESYSRLGVRHTRKHKQTEKRGTVKMDRKMSRYEAIQKLVKLHEASEKQ